MRAIIELKDEQLKELAEICAREKISRAEAIRKAVDCFIDLEHPKSGTSAAFGLWRGRQIDSLEYVDQLRDEWVR